MTDLIPIPFSESVIIAAVEAYLNKTFFKHPTMITSITSDVGTFIVTVQPPSAPPDAHPLRVLSPRKTKARRRGMAGPVLEPHPGPTISAEQRPNGAEQTA